MNTQDAIHCRYLAARDHLNERQRRLFAAAEARALGYGGIAIVAQATGIAPSTLARGLKDLDAARLLTGVVRRPGAGRPSIADSSPGLLEDLRTLVEPATMGDPMRALLWVSKSQAKLAAALAEKGHTLCANTVAVLLEHLGFRRQANRKTREGASHPDRDAQFEYINDQAAAFAALGEPVISVDTKKKEILGDFKNAGSDYRPTATPDRVRTHDFMDKALGKAIPHGIYDIGANAGWVTVGIDNDTAEFAVNSLRLWWEKMGHSRYPKATCVLITADGGGSNGWRLRLWKRELQAFAEETGLSIVVCHYPPGTSKWNKIEHRLFCQISQNWRGKPLTSRLAIVELIGATTTTTGLTVRCELDTRTYAKAIKVSDEELINLNIQRAAFHPDWNYTIHPRLRKAHSDHALILE
jgi:hypothetical protein